MRLTPRDEHIEQWEYPEVPAVGPNGLSLVPHGTVVQGIVGLAGLVPRCIEQVPPKLHAGG